MNNDFVKNHSDVLLVLLMAEEKFTFLPELCKVFGEESLFKFLDIFAGVTFNVPAKEKLLKAFRDIHIWYQLSNRGSASVSELSELYSLEKSTIYSIYSNVESILKRNKDTLIKINTKV